MRSVRAKLEEFDRHAEAAVDDLIRLLQQDREQLIVYARGKLVWGHYRYRDRLMYEYGQEQLLAEAVEELGDAINYLARRQTLANGGN